MTSAAVCAATSLPRSQRAPYYTYIFGRIIVTTIHDLRQHQVYRPHGLYFRP